MKTKKAKAIIVGDKVILTVGDHRTVTRVSKGMYANSTLIEWHGGWSCQLNTAELILA